MRAREREKDWTGKKRRRRQANPYSSFPTLSPFFLLRRFLHSWPRLWFTRLPSWFSNFVVLLSFYSPLVARFPPLFHSAFVRSLVRSLAFDERRRQRRVSFSSVLLFPPSLSPCDFVVVVVVLLLLLLRLVLSRSSIFFPLASAPIRPSALVHQWRFVFFPCSTLIRCWRPLFRRLPRSPGALVSPTDPF